MVLEFWILLFLPSLSLPSLFPFPFSLSSFTLFFLPSFPCEIHPLLFHQLSAVSSRQSQNDSLLMTNAISPHTPRQCWALSHCYPVSTWIPAAPCPVTPSHTQSPTSHQVTPVHTQWPSSESDILLPTGVLLPSPWQPKVTSPSPKYAYHLQTSDYSCWAFFFSLLSKWYFNNTFVELW